VTAGQGGQEIDLHLANVASGRLDLAQPPMIGAWGRRLPWTTVSVGACDGVTPSW